MPVRTSGSRRRRSKSAVKTLLAGGAHVRTARAKPSRRKQAKPKRPRSKAIASSPREMDALVSASLRFPMRVMACRTPLQLWLEQARLMHAWLVAGQSVAFARPFVPPFPVP